MLSAENSLISKDGKIQEEIPREILAEVCAFHYDAFMYSVLPDLFYTKSFSPFHRYLLKLIEDNQKTRRRRVVAGPRGWGKSTTISEGGPLWIVCRNDYLPPKKRYKYILLVSDTQPQAEKRLTTIKEYLESDIIAYLFPHAHGPGKKWKSSEIITKNDILIGTAGLKSSIRGTKYKNRRPDLIIVDDPDNLESVTSPSLSATVEEVFTRDLVKAGSEDADILVVGTVLAKTALVYKLLYSEDYAAWEGKIFKALVSFPERMDLWDEFGEILKDRENKFRKKDALKFYFAHKEEMLKGAKSLWEEVYPVRKLMEEYYLEGRRAFMLEKQNEIIEDEEGVFRPEKYKYYEDEELEKIYAYHPLIYVYVDPTGGKQKSRGIGRRKGDSDLFSLCALAKLDNNLIYFIDNKVGQLRQSEQYFLIYKFIKEYEEKGLRIFKLLVEDRGDNYYVNGLKEFLTRRGLRRPVPQVVTHRVNKVERISMLEPYLDNWTLILPANRRRFKEFYTELETYPYCDFDDVLDSLSGCFFAAYKTFRLRYA